MTITIPRVQALHAAQGLQKLMASNFPARDAFRISKLVATLNANPDLTALEAVRSATVQRFGVKENGAITVPPERMPEFLAEYEPVAMTPMELEIVPLPASVLDHAPEMTPQDMLTLEPFFEE